MNNTITIEKAIEKKANDECGRRTDCIVSIKEFAKFEWDSFYVFNYAHSDIVINNAMGTNYPHYKSNTRPWVFTKNSLIVYYENNPSGIERAINNQVYFDYPDSIDCKIYTPKDSLFKVEIKAVDSKTNIIVLHQFPQ